MISSDDPPPTARKIILTGAAGLVGQNLTLLLRERGYHNLVAIDKHANNLRKLAELNPGVRAVAADLAERSAAWEGEFADADCVVILQAQITGLDESEFERNNVVANRHLVEVCQQHRIPHVIQISSSVWHSKAEDSYVRTKTRQEEIIKASGLDYTILRPTLMFGWFDPKHLGWLARFMEKSPIFPVPGDGKFVRQPLYNRDFCRIILHCIEHRPVGEIFDIVGGEDIEYIELIRLIKATKGLKTRIVHLPFRLFDALLKLYALVDRHPPFTSAQLHALAVGDYFQGVDTQQQFGIRLTPIKDAIAETFTDSRYASVVLER